MPSRGRKQSIQSFSGNCCCNCKVSPLFTADSNYRRVTLYPNKQNSGKLVQLSEFRNRHAKYQSEDWDGGLKTFGIGIRSNFKLNVFRMKRELPVPQVFGSQSFVVPLEVGGGCPAQKRQCFIQGSTPQNNAFFVTYPSSGITTQRSTV